MSSCQLKAKKGKHAIQLPKCNPLPNFKWDPHCIFLDLINVNTLDNSQALLNKFLEDELT
jgi:hypothetical protein